MGSCWKVENAGELWTICISSHYGMIRRQSSAHIRQWSHSLLRTNDIVRVVPNRIRATSTYILRACSRREDRHSSWKALCSIIINNSIVNLGWGSWTLTTGSNDNRKIEGLLTADEESTTRNADPDDQRLSRSQMIWRD